MIFDLILFATTDFRASFHGHDSPMGLNVYGGLLFAQGMQAAQMDVPEGFLPTALHSLFVSYPFSKYPIDYKVQHLRDGGSFCARSITGIQNNNVVFSGIANFSKVGHKSFTYVSIFLANRNYHLSHGSVA